MLLLNSLTSELPTDLHRLHFTVQYCSSAASLSYARRLLVHLKLKRIHSPDNYNTYHISQRCCLLDLWIPMLARYLWTTLLLTPSTNHQGQEWVLNPWLRLMKTSVKNLHNAALQYNKQQRSSNKWYAEVQMAGRPPVISSVTAVLVLVLMSKSTVSSS